jgi:ribose transport system permease protein
MRRPLAWAADRRWVWPLIGIALLWAALAAATSRFSLLSLSGVLSSAALLAFPAIGQMFVVTTGRGNVDLSVPGVMTLGGFLTTILVGPSDAMALPGLAAVAAMGAAVGALNALLVLRARVPAMVATMGTGYVLATASLLANRGRSGFGVAPALDAAANGRVMGVPVLALVAALVAAAAGLALRRTGFGAALAAVGQNPRAAALAGVGVGRTVAAAFVLSGLCSALGGAMLSAGVGGAFLGMGTPYLLQCVGAVVVGGTLVAGGSATALGTFLGCVLLVLTVTTMQVAGLPPGAQDIVQGLAIIGVLALAGDRSRRTGR